MSDAGTAAPAKGLLARCLQFVVTLAVFAAIGGLGLAAWANWRHDGTFTLHVFDPVWWGVGRSEAEPYVAGARTAVDKAYQEVWGSGGLIDQSERWLDGLHHDDAAPPAAGDPSAAGPSATPAPPANPAARRSPEALRHEARFTQAESDFRAGLAAYKRAAAGSTTSARHARDEAIADFGRCRDTLLTSLDAYRALPDHDRRRLADAEELGRMNQRFLHDAQKASGGL